MKKTPLLTLEQMTKARRERCGLTQHQVATELGYSTAQFVSNWERGRCTIPVEHFRKIAQLLGIPIRELVDHRTRDVRRDLIRRVRCS